MSASKTRSCSGCSSHRATPYRNPGSPPTRKISRLRQQLTQNRPSLRARAVAVFNVKSSAIWIFGGGGILGAALGVSLFFMPDRRYDEIGSQVFAVLFLLSGLGAFIFAVVSRGDRPASKVMSGSCLPGAGSGVEAPASAHQVDMRQPPPMIERGTPHA